MRLAGTAYPEHLDVKIVPILPSQVEWVLGDG
jgi:hypothetical protein